MFEVFVVTMDDNASDSPDATVEMTTGDRKQARAHRDALACSEMCAEYLLTNYNEGDV